MIAVLQEKLAQDPLGAVDIALGEHPGSREHGCGQSLELQCLLGRCGRRVCLSARPAKHSEGLPGGEERGIERDRAAVSLDRVSALPRGAIAVAALLEKTAEVGVELLEAPKSPERVVNAAEVALAHGDEIEDVPVLGDLLEQAAGIGEGAREFAFHGQPANAKHLGLDPGACAKGLGGCHQAIIARRRGGRPAPPARATGGAQAWLFLQEPRVISRRNDRSSAGPVCAAARCSRTSRTHGNWPR